jgi:hypothetical protein
MRIFDFIQKFFRKELEPAVAISEVVIFTQRRRKFEMRRHNTIEDMLNEMDERRMSRQLRREHFLPTKDSYDEEDFSSFQ